MSRVFRQVRVLKRALLCAAADDAFNVSQSAAYSSILAVFPTVIVVAAIVPMLPDVMPIRAQLSNLFQRVLPETVSALLAGYFAPDAKLAYNSTRALLLGAAVSVYGASNVITTFMEGLRRAYGLPQDCWSFSERRLRALALVPMSLLPLTLASLLVIFGNFLAVWLAGHAMPAIRHPLLVFALVVRWTVALTSVVGLIALLFKWGTPLRQRWRAVLPGAVLATVFWMASTIAFGWYVTRFANYSLVYGSLGAGVALLVWLYLTSLSVLCGAEFNAQLRAQREGHGAGPQQSTVATPGESVADPVRELPLN